MGSMNSDLLQLGASSVSALTFETHSYRHSQCQRALLLLELNNRQNGRHNFYYNGMVYRLAR